MSIILINRPTFVNPTPPSPSGRGAGGEGDPTDSSPARPRYEVADVFQLYGDAFRRTHRLTLGQAKVMRAIEVCRTAALGGHIEECGACAFRRPVYNSCRNRHCPKCQKLATKEWLAARQAELLPVGYFHNVFTLPHEINPLAAANPRRIYTMLFHSVSAVLQTFAADPQYGLGGIPGITAVLHTWDQQLQYHLHLHCIIAAGALAFDGSRWIAANPKFLFPFRPLADAYRAHFLKALARAHRRDELVLPGALAAPGGVNNLIEILAGKNWVTFERAPFAGPDNVLEYLSRYTHRVAISNQRILDIDDGRVTFAYRDRKDGNRRKELTISADEFMRRFLLHVVPRGMPRMRHYGILSNRNKTVYLPVCRALLGQPAPDQTPAPVERVALLLELTGFDVTLCPQCGSKMTSVEEIPRQGRKLVCGPPAPPRPSPAGDTS